MIPDLLAAVAPALEGNKHMLLLRRYMLAAGAIGYKAAFVSTCCGKTVAVGEAPELAQAIQLAVTNFEGLAEGPIQ